jgi:hypothetical protein
MDIATRRILIFPGFFGGGGNERLHSRKKQISNLVRIKGWGRYDPLIHESWSYAFFSQKPVKSTSLLRHNHLNSLPDF